MRRNPEQWQDSSSSSAAAETRRLHISFMRYVYAAAMFFLSAHGRVVVLLNGAKLV